MQYAHKKNIVAFRKQRDENAADPLYATLRRENQKVGQVNKIINSR